MMRHNIGNVQSALNAPIEQKRIHTDTNGHGPSFSELLKDAIQHVNDVEIASDNITKAFITGEVNELHDVMIAAQKASITIETTVQIQRKAIDAYNEIMRMQV